MVLATVVLLVASVSIACGNKSGNASSAMAAVTLTGQIVDANQFVVQKAGCSDQAGCGDKANMQAKIAFYNDADKQLYFIRTTEQAKPAYKLADFLAKRVEITGVVQNSTDSRSVQIQSIKELKESEKISQLR
jgi:hypothetical protein